MTKVVWQFMINKLQSGRRQAQNTEIYPGTTRLWEFVEHLTSEVPASQWKTSIREWLNVTECVRCFFDKYDFWDCFKSQSDVHPWLFFCWKLFNLSIRVWIRFVKVLLCAEDWQNSDSKYWHLCNIPCSLSLEMVDVCNWNFSVYFIWWVHKQSALLVERHLNTF